MSDVSKDSGDQRDMPAGGVTPTAPARRPKNYGGPGIEQMPAVDKAVVEEIEDAHAALLADPSPTNKRRFEDAKLVLRQRREYWRKLGEELGTRTGAHVTNYITADGEPVLDTPEAQAYWEEVQAAVEAGVPYAARIGALRSF